MKNLATVEPPTNDHFFGLFVTNGKVKVTKRNLYQASLLSFRCLVSDWLIYFDCVKYLYAKISMFF